MTQNDSPTDRTRPEPVDVDAPWDRLTDYTATLWDRLTDYAATRGTTLEVEVFSALISAIAEHEQQTASLALAVLRVDEKLDALTARLYGSPDDGGTGGDVNALRDDVLELTGGAGARTVDAVIRERLAHLTGRVAYLESANRHRNAVATDAPAGYRADETCEGAAL